MKLKENQQFDALISALNYEAQFVQLIGRLESYSCKLVKSEKRQFKLMKAAGDGLSPNDLEALSPPKLSPPMSSPSFSLMGRLDDSAEDLDVTMISRKTFFYLIGTLNASFAPDVDFSDCRGEDFSKEKSIQNVMDAVDLHFLGSPAREEYNSVRCQLWNTIDNHINLSDCEIYSFNPPPSFNPFNELILWQFYYFFYSRKLKRVVFFAYRNVRKEEEMEEFQESFDME